MPNFIWHLKNRTTETPLIMEQNCDCLLLPVSDVESGQTLAALERVVTALEGLGDVTTVLRVGGTHTGHTYSLQLQHCIAITMHCYV